MKHTLFNDRWTWKQGTGSPLSGLFNKNSGEVSVTLPHDANQEYPRNPEPVHGASAANAYFEEHNSVYSKGLFVPAEDAGKIHILQFDGVYHNAFVFVNNSFVGKHPYGYGDFSLDITNYLIPGQTNSITVSVKSAHASSRWYAGSGIYRSVYLLTADRLHLEPEHSRFTLLDLEEDLAVLQAEAMVINQRSLCAHTRVTFRLFDATGALAGEASAPAFVPAGESYPVTTRLYVRKPHTWSAEDPYLYTWQVSLEEKPSSGSSAAASESSDPGSAVPSTTSAAPIDIETGTFGIRKLQLDPIHGLRVNGISVNLKGGCIHHDNGILGACEYPHAAENKIRKLKRAGYNAIRSAHNPISREMLAACDKYGIYVMDEFSDVWTTTKEDFDYGMSMSEWWPYDIKKMVEKDYNHPSVIFYSVGNEIPEIGNPFDLQFGRKMAELIRSMDHTRYITNGMNLMFAVADRVPELLQDVTSSAEEINALMYNLGETMARLISTDILANETEETSSHVDITGYNYAAIRYELDKVKYPNRVIVGSETYPRDLDVNWELVERNAHVIGDFSWTCWDYIGEAGIGQIVHGEELSVFYGVYPWKLAYCADYNLIGTRRPVSYWRQSIWEKDLPPYIAVQPPQYYGSYVGMSTWSFSDAIHSWNFAGYENTPVKIEVYSDAEEVELFLNGSSLGRRRTGVEKKNIASFDTSYVPGILEAISYRGGQEISRSTLTTAGDNVHLALTVDSTPIPADGSDICLIRVDLLDEKGTLNPEKAETITVSVEGAGVLAGAGGADPVSEESYHDSSFRLFEGQALLAIRGQGCGTVTVTVSGKSCEPVSICIEAV